MFQQRDRRWQFASLPLHLSSAPSPAAAASVDAAKPPSPLQRKDQPEKCPSAPPYMPTKEADFTNWLNNFSTLIVANHEYMVPDQPTA